MQAGGAKAARQEQAAAFYEAQQAAAKATPEPCAVAGAAPATAERGTRAATRGSKSKRREETRLHCSGGPRV